MDTYDEGNLLKTKCGAATFGNIFTNDPMHYHLTAIGWLSFSMLIIFGVVFFLKLIPVLSFLICPMFQIRVGKMLKKKPAQIKDTSNMSQKSINFMRKVEERRKLRAAGKPAN